MNETLKEIWEEETRADWNVPLCVAGLLGVGTLMLGILTRDDSYDDHVCASVDGEVELLSPVISENSIYTKTGVRMGAIKEDISREDMIVGNYLNENILDGPKELDGNFFFQLDLEESECSFGNISNYMWDVPYVGKGTLLDEERIRVIPKLNM